MKFTQPAIPRRRFFLRVRNVCNDPNADPNAAQPTDLLLPVALYLDTHGESDAGLDIPVGICG